MLAGEEFELPLLRLVTGGGQALVRLLAGGGLFATHDLTALIAQQVLASQTALCVVRGSVEHLRLAANRHHVSASDHTVLSVSVSGCVVHPFLSEQQIFFRGGQSPTLLFSRNDGML